MEKTLETACDKFENLCKYLATLPINKKQYNDICGLVREYSDCSVSEMLKDFTMLPMKIFKKNDTNCNPESG